MSKRIREHTLEIRSIDEGTEDFDIAFWQAQGPSAIAAAAWEMAVLAHFAQGGTQDELRFCRTAVTIQQIPS